MVEAQHSRRVDRSEEQGPRVVIVGAGFGGLWVARGLKDTKAQVTIIDRQNHHLFQPLLYQVATAAVSPADVALPIRSLFTSNQNISVLMDEIIGIDAANKDVLSRSKSYGYEYLVVSTGSEYAYFGHEGWRALVLSLKTLEDALYMREQILLAFEQAETAPDEVQRRKLMTFIIVGGGPTGVELAGAIAELAKSTLARDFRHIVPAEAEILLLEAGPTLLSGFPKRLIDFAQKALERKGVTVRLETPVQDIRDDAVVVGKNGEVIPAATVLWAAGTQAGGISGWLGTETDAMGRIKVRDDLSVPGHPEIFVIGDAAHCAGPDEEPLPAVAPVAKQQGTFVARLIWRRIAGDQPPKPFRYRDEGMLATIGRGAAVANLRWIKLTGWVAWMFWGLVHIYFLIGFRNRMMVFLNWVWGYFIYGLGARLITGRQIAHQPDLRTASPRRHTGGRFR